MAVSPGLGVKDQVDEALACVARIADDEGAGVESLAETGSNLRRVGISHQVELDDRSAAVSTRRHGEGGLSPYPVMSALPTPIKYCEGSSAVPLADCFSLKRCRPGAHGGYPDPASNARSRPAGTPS